MKKVFGWHNHNMRVASKQQAFAYFLTRLLHIVSQMKQSKQLLTKEIRVLSEETKYIFLQRKEKKCNLFIYFMNPDNSNIKKNFKKSQ